MHDWKKERRPHYLSALKFRHFLWKVISKLANKHVFLPVGLIIFSFSCCAPQDDESALRELVDKGVSLAEEHDIVGLIDLTTEDFKAKPGDFDRTGVKRILFVTFRHYGQINILHPRPKVEVESKEKGPSVTFPFLIVRKDRSIPDLKDLYEDPRGWVEKVGENADLYRLSLGVVKKNGQWLVKTAYTESFSTTGFHR